MSYDNNVKRFAKLYLFQMNTHTVLTLPSYLCINKALRCLAEKYNNWCEERKFPMNTENTVGSEN